MHQRLCKPIALYGKRITLLSRVKSDYIISAGVHTLTLDEITMLIRDCVATVRHFRATRKQWRSVREVAPLA